MTTTNRSEPAHAYGTADDVPELPARAATDPADPAWGEPWSRLCHQGGVYSAGYAALPELMRIARAWAADGRTTPPGLAASIVASGDWRHDVADPIALYGKEIAELAALTEDALRLPELADRPGDYFGAARRRLRRRPPGRRGDRRQTGRLTGRRATRPIGRPAAGSG